MTNVKNRLKTTKGRYAPNTLKSYYADARMFVDWCRQKNIEPFPITSRNALLLHRIFTTKRCLQLNPAADIFTQRLNKMLGFEDQTHSEDVYLAIRRLKRSKSLEQSRPPASTTTSSLK